MSKQFHQINKVFNLNKNLKINWNLNSIYRQKLVSFIGRNYLKSQYQSWAIKNSNSN